MRCILNLSISVTSACYLCWKMFGMIPPPIALWKEDGKVSLVVGWWQRLVTAAWPGSAPASSQSLLFPFGSWFPSIEGVWGTSYILSISLPFWNFLSFSLPFWNFNHIDGSPLSLVIDVCKEERSVQSLCKMLLKGWCSRIHRLVND